MTLDESYLWLSVFKKWVQYEKEKKALVSSSKQVLCELPLQVEFLWFGQPFITAETSPTSLNELRVLIKILSLLDPYKSRCLQRQTSAFPKGLALEQLQSLGIHQFRMCSLEQHGTKNSR